MARSFLVLVLVLASACVRDPVATDLSRGANVSVAKVETGIRLTNNTSSGIAYAVSNPNWLGLLAICNDPGPACVRLAANESITIPFSEMQGLDSNTESVKVYWWHVVPDGDGFKASDPVELVVQLK